MSLDHDWVSVLTPRLVYVGIADRSEFDRIAAPVRDDGADGGPKVLVKSVEEHGVQVVFQHWYGPKPSEEEANAVIERLRLGAGAVA